MPGLVAVQWTVDGIEREPETSFFEQVKFADLTVACELVGADGMTHSISAKLTFDPPITTARSVIER